MKKFEKKKIGRIEKRSDTTTAFKKKAGEYIFPCSLFE